MKIKFNETLLKKCSYYLYQIQYRDDDRVLRDRERQPNNKSDVIVVTLEVVMERMKAATKVSHDEGSNSG